MGHLTTGKLVDLAEGARDDASMPHLAECDVCRQQLADLRAMVSVTAADDRGVVPEPSPLFWDHLSARVRDAVRNEELPARESSFLAGLGRWSLPLTGPVTGLRLAAGAVACGFVIAMAAALLFRGAAPAGQAPAAEQTAREHSVEVPAVPLGSPDDPSLSLVADYGGTLDWDEMREEMAVSSHAGGMNASVVDLNGEERQELQRLLKEELARPAGASLAPDRS